MEKINLVVKKNIGAISIIGLVILMICFSGESSKQNTGDSRLLIEKNLVKRMKALVLIYLL